MQVQELRTRLLELEEGLEAIQSILDELLPQEEDGEEADS